MAPDYDALKALSRERHDLEQSSTDGISSDDAHERLEIIGSNKLGKTKDYQILKFLLFTWNPLAWIMEVAAVMAIALADGGGKPPDLFGNFCICTVLLGMLVQIIVMMYPIQNSSYQSGINSLLVLLIGRIPTALFVTMAIGSYCVSQQILNIVCDETVRLIRPQFHATITKFAKRGLHFVTVAYQDNKILKFLQFTWNPLAWIKEVAAVMAIALTDGGDQIVPRLQCRTGRRKIPVATIFWLLAICGLASLDFATAFPAGGRGEEAHEASILVKFILTIFGILTTGYLFHLFTRAFRGRQPQVPPRHVPDDQEIYFDADDDDLENPHHSPRGDTTNDNVDPERRTPGTNQFERRVINGRPEMIWLLHIYAFLGAVVIGFAGNLLGGTLSIKPFLLRTAPELYNRQENAKNNNYCDYVDINFASLISIVPIGSTFMGLVALYLSRMIGRKPVSYIASLFVIIGTSLVIAGPGTPTIIGFIFIGCGVGLYAWIVPVICSESVPLDLQRRFSVLCSYQAAGVALVSVVSYIGASYPEWGWVIPFTVLLVLSVTLAGVSYFLEETPVYFFERKRYIDSIMAQTRLRHGRLYADAHRERIQFESDMERAGQTNTFMELFQVHLPTFRIMLAASILPQLVSTIPVVFFGPLIATSLVENAPKVPFLISLIGGVLGLLVTLLTSCGLPTLRRRRLLLGASLLAIITVAGLFFIFRKSVHPTVNIERGPSIGACCMMILNYVAFSVLTNPHGWTNTSIGASSTFGSLIVGSLSSALNFVKTYYSVRLLCKVGSWGYLLDGVFGVICFLFVLIFIPESMTVIPTTASG